MWNIITRCWYHNYMWVPALRYALQWTWCWMSQGKKFHRKTKDALFIKLSPEICMLFKLWWTSHAQICFSTIAQVSSARKSKFFYILHCLFMRQMYHIGDPEPHKWVPQTKVQIVSGIDVYKGSEEGTAIITKKCVYTSSGPHIWAVHHEGGPDWHITVGEMTGGGHQISKRPHDVNVGASCPKHTFSCPPYSFDRYSVMAVGGYNLKIILINFQPCNRKRQCWHIFHRILESLRSVWT